MGAYIITNSELIDIANAIRQKLSSDDSFTLEDMPTAITNIGKITGSGATIVEGNDIKYLIDEDKIKAIADAVREKNGSSDTYSLSELPQAILDIVTATYTINYYNGSTLLYSETVSSGGNGSYSGSTPTKTSDAQYSYTFVGWSNGTDDNTVDNDALSDIDGDRNIYACFTETLRTYTVKFVRASADGGRTLQTLNNVAYGTVLTNNSYTGSTPTTFQTVHRLSKKEAGAQVLTHVLFQRLSIEAWKTAAKPGNNTDTYLKRTGERIWKKTRISELPQRKN